MWNLTSVRKGTFLNSGLFEEIKRRQEQSSTSFDITEAKKIKVLEHLENARTKIKSARVEIRRAVKVTLKMKEAGDDIANQVISSIVNAQTKIFEDTTNLLFRRERILELWFPKLK